MKTFLSALAVALFLAAPAFASNTLNLGFYELQQPGSADWVYDDSGAPNHEARFVNSKTGNEIFVSFYVLTEYEKRFRTEEALIRFIDQGRSGVRRYRYVKEQNLVLTFIAKQSDPELVLLAQNVKIIPGFPISPCLRLGKMTKQFKKIADSGNPELADEYIESLKSSLNQRLAKGDKHCAAPINYLLGQIECYNSNWEAARTYYKRALEARPNASEPAQAIEAIKNL